MCEHTNTTIYTSGSMSFYGGDVSDTLQDIEVCLQCGKDLPIPQEETTDKFILMMRLSKTKREWEAVTNRIYDEPDRSLVEALAKRADDLLEEIDKLYEQIDNITTKGL